MATGTIKKPASAKFDMYDSVADLGLTVGSATIAGAWAAMRAPSILITQGGEFASSQVPATLGTVEIVKGINDTRGWIYFYGKDISVGDYRMGLATYGGPSGTWVRQYAGLTTSTTMVTLAASATSENVTAPTVSGGTFLCWLQPSGSGHTTLAYIQQPNQSSTKLWVPSSTSSARNFLCTALYLI